MDLQLAKGVRDFPPEDKILREDIIKTLKEVFERYGFNPFETPVIERLETLKAKFAAGEGSDAFKEIFTLKDQGKRELGLRFELTLPLCRYMAMNRDIKLPFKRYEIGRVYRDGPIKLGRYREFWQCDIDIVGTDSMMADAEALSVVKDVFEKLKLPVEIVVSNRKLLNGILEKAGVSKKLRNDAMIAIDKLKKIGEEGVEKELKERGIKDSSIEEIRKILAIKGSNEERLKDLEYVDNEQGKQGLEEIRELLGYLDALEVDVVFDQTLARGLGYYTGPIFEAFLKDSKITSSVVGGGRYDEYIGNFIGSGKVPATGLSFGLEPITEALKGGRKTVTKVFIIPIKTPQESLEIANVLRKKGINTEIDLSGRGISANLQYANSYGIPYVVFVGKRELEQGKVKLRDMKTGEEKMVDPSEISV